MTEFLSARRYLFELNSVWTDLTSYVIEDVTGGWGIAGDGPLDLLAEPGITRLVFNNVSGQFDPDSLSALAGWRRGIGFRMEFDYDGETYRHAGTVHDIDVPLSDDLVDHAFVTVKDWLEYSALHPIVNPGIQTNQRGNEVLDTLLALMPIPPAATDFAEGDSIFPTTFDTVTSKTKAYSEMDKVARSEGPGYIYLRKDRVNGETLVFESSQARHGWQALSDLPLHSSDAGDLLKEDGGYLLKEDGGKIILNQTQTLTLDNAMIDLEAEHGKRVLNYFTIVANPRSVDATPQVLFELDEPILIGSGQTIDIKGSYVDIASGLPINGQNMITPVATTDYLANTASDGSGTNLTTSLVLVSIVYGTEGFTHRVRNDSVNAGYVTRWSPRGYGIYKYNPITHAEKDDDSVAAYGYQTETFDQPYQTTLERGSLYGARVVELERTPRTRVVSVSLLANQSAALMLAFLNFGPGSKFRAIHTKRGIDSYFHIQHVDYKITDGGLIMFKWLVKQFWSLSLGLEPLAVEFRGETEQDGIHFGHLPHLANLPERAMCAWIRRTSDSPQVKADFIAGLFSDDASFAMYISGGTTKRLTFLQKYSGAGGGQGVWASPDNSILDDTLYHVMVVKDLSSDSLPKLYINGVSQTIQTIQSPPAGRTAFDESGVPFVIGNVKTATGDYDSGFKGKNFDVRVYDHEPSDAEKSVIYNSGTPDATVGKTEGLLFQGPCVRTKDFALYEDQTLNESLKVLDNVFGAVGTPHDAPVGRAAV